MAYPAYLRERARELRIKNALSIDELAERLALPKTTVYYWVKDLPLGRKPRWSGTRGNLATQEKWRLLREAAYEQGRTEYERLVVLPTFRDFVVLYIAEGYKRDRNCVSIANSDERVVVVAARWFQKLSTKRLEYGVQYHADQDLGGLRAYWADVLGIEGSLIMVWRKSNSGQLTGRVWRSEHGVMTVRVWDTLLRARIQAWIDRVREDWG
jgi:hypothetical protein